LVYYYEVPEDIFLVKIAASGAMKFNFDLRHAISVEYSSLSRRRASYSSL